VFEDHRNIYIVLEYYPHGDLITFFKDKELLPEDELRMLFLKIVIGIERLHRHKIIHRDIKMDNILLDKNYEPVISDFGISSVYHPGQPIMDTGGTPAYLAPEVIKADGGIGFKTDVWGLGVLLFALAYGHVPFEGEDIQDLYRTILIGRFKFPSRSRCSPELADLINRMIVVETRRRYGIADVLKHPWMAKAVEAHLKETSQEEKTDKARERARKEAYIRYLNDAGFGLDFIYESVAHRQFNHVTSCFENLMRS
jgi:serine/threonine protein kinase